MTKTDVDVDRALCKAPSPSDTWGLFYAFLVTKGGRRMVKLGRAQMPENRALQWAAKCRGQEQSWLDGWWVPHATKFGEYGLLWSSFIYCAIRARRPHRTQAPRRVDHADSVRILRGQAPRIFRSRCIRRRGWLEGDCRTLRRGVGLGRGAPGVEVWTGRLTYLQNGFFCVLILTWTATNYH